MENNDQLDFILSHLKNVSKGKESPQKNLIYLTISEFEKSRPKTGSEIAKYASRIIEKYGELLISDQQLFGSLYNIATYIKWKCLTDLNTTALNIYHNTIIPTTKIMDKYFKPSNTKIREPKNLAYVPSLPLFPRNFNNANQTAALGLIDCFIESQNRESHLSVFIYKENAPQLELRKYYSKIDFVICDSFLNLNNEIKSRNCDALIQDYFMWGQLILSYNFHHIPTIYLDPGFLPFFITPVKKIISLPAQRNFVKQFQNNSQRVSYIDRPYANISNLVDLSKRKKFKQDSIIFGSLGRGEKLQKEYVDYVANILREVENSKFLWAGERSKEKINEFPLDVRERVDIYEPMVAGEFLKDIDIFLETFPENQGYAALDALHMKCVLITYDPKNTNTNKSERIKDHIFNNLSDVIYFINQIIYDENKRAELINKQDALINTFPKKKDYWEKFIASIKQ